VKPGDRVACISFDFCGTCDMCRRGLTTGCPNVRAIPFLMDGAYADNVLVTALMACPFDESVSFAEATLAEPAANGYGAAEHGRIYPGEHVVVIGPRSIGLLALQAAKIGAPETLTMLGTRAERLQLATKLGATQVVHVREVDPYEAVMNITDGHGADVVILCAGTEDVWDTSSKILAF